MILETLLDLVEEGTVEPTAAQIAERADIAERSIRQHFPTRQQLFTAAVEVYTQRVAPSNARVDPGLTLSVRIARFAEARGKELERCAPMRRASASLASVPQQVRERSSLGRAVDGAWQRRRAELGHTFAAELAVSDDPKRLLDVLDLLSHGSAWDTLRGPLGLSPKVATERLRWSLAAALGASAASRS